MHRRHLSLLETEVIEKHLDHRRKSIRGTGRIRDDVVLARVIGVRVDAEHERDILAGRRSADDNFLDRALPVLAGFGGVREQAGGFNYNLDPLVAPGMSPGFRSENTRIFLLLMTRSLPSAATLRRSRP